MKPTLSLKIMGLLALAQGVFGLLLAYGWVHVGVDLFRDGLLILPVVGTLAVLRGMFVAAVAFLYLLFSCGALLGSPWAWSVGLTAAVINLLLALSALLQGAPLMQVIGWSVVPAILLFHFVFQKDVTRSGRLAGLP
jgi:hypothetical protein